MPFNSLTQYFVTMKTIIAPTDFSTISLNAINYAADLACVLNANISLLHVCPIPMSYSDVPIPDYDLAEMINEAESRIKLLKEKIRSRTLNRILIKTEVRQGDIVQEINKYCVSINPYLVVMGKESLGSVERLLLGGKTLSAIEKLSWPLMIVPEGRKFSGICKIGLACDLKKVFETIPISEIKELLTTFKADFHVLHVSNDPSNTFNAQTVSESVVLRNMFLDLHPTYHFLQGTNVERKIIEFATANDFDLLIVIPKKHNFINKLFKHSASKKLSLHTNVPVISIHA